METLLAVLMVLAIHIGTPTVIGLAIVGSTVLAEQTKLQSRKLVCAIDADCPPGYVCIGSRCTPQQAS